MKVAPERPLTIGAGPRALEARLADVGPAPCAGAVLCHPHPEYGGSMDNAVVVAVASALAAGGFTTLRFNFGGVGRSEGGFSGGPAEVDDARAAFAALTGLLPPGKPLVVVGYSFGAWVALRLAAEAPGLRHVVAVGPPLGFLDWSFLDAVPAPITFVAGDRDQFCDRARLARVLTAHAGRIELRTIGGADHFLLGREDEAATAVRDALRSVA
ncbi:MAG TPA: alpha/beta fold hydrolase [Candidatus Nitrosopolaris sp.]|nr:alpha/beta fold hydrolase [Candidatus Nitrosopolaris sp.]